ncbi:MAG TPA: TA system VapC family ribonuclease toxin [Gemmatimonadota bacterium]|nr:TA system VapC family ribonuclease toxin [Gemmatimonadota bacterium]
MTLLDTNVLLYATFEGFPEHVRARELLREIAEDGDPHCVTWINLFEYLRAATHRRMLRPAPLPLGKAVDNVVDLLDHPSVSRIDPGPRHLEVFRDLCREAGVVDGNFVHDCRIAAIMRENAVSRIVTRDTSFRRIPGLEVLDPFA